MNYSVYFVVGDKTIQLPVNPEEIKIVECSNITSVNVIGLGRVTVPQDAGLAQYHFTFELSDRRRSYAGDYRYDGTQLLSMLQGYRKRHVVIRFVALGERFETSKYVLIKSMIVVQRGGEESDYEVTIELVEYQNFQQEVLQTHNGATAVVEKTGQGIGESGILYTVVKGDSLWKIAKRELGNGARFMEIYEVNKDKVKNPNLIYPGQILMLP